MTRPLAAVLFALAVSAGFARAEKIDLTPAELRKTATHVVTGTVVAVYHRTTVEGDWKYTRSVAEFRVADSEKGDGIKPGDLIYARYWHRTWVGTGQMPPNTTGHRGVPGEGETARVYLARNAYDGFTRANTDGGLNVIGANGFEAWKPTPGK